MKSWGSRIKLKCSQYNKHFTNYVTMMKMTDDGNGNDDDDDDDDDELNMLLVHVFHCFCHGHQSFHRAAPERALAEIFWCVSPFFSRWEGTTKNVGRAKRDEFPFKSDYKTCNIKQFCWYSWWCKLATAPGLACTWQNLKLEGMKLWGLITAALMPQTTVSTVKCPLSHPPIQIN